MRGNNPVQQRMREESLRHLNRVALKSPACGAFCSQQVRSGKATPAHCKPSSTCAGRTCFSKLCRSLPSARSSAASGVLAVAPRSGMDGSLQEQNNQVSVIIEENKPHKRFKL
jgi:hypothetical protein